MGVFPIINIQIKTFYFKKYTENVNTIHMLNSIILRYQKQLFSFARLH